jgi:serine/threonine-protein kinase
MADDATLPANRRDDEKTGILESPAIAPTINSAADAPTEKIELGAAPTLPGYDIVGELGRGGMGVVYKAHQIALNRIVALKVVLSGAHAKPEDLIRFLGEAEVAARLQHQGIVQIFQSGRHEGLPFYTMEFADGGSLSDRLRKGRMQADEAARMALALAEATQIAHDAGVIHRDLKPSNILLTSGGQPKITDFGLARRLEASGGLTLTGTILGTPSYMAPEQARGDTKRIGAAADIYSIGAILYECLTGRPPFVGKYTAETITQVLSEAPVRVRSLAGGVPRDLETICQKCLEKDPAQRYRSAGALAEDLQRWLDGRSPHGRSGPLNGSGAGRSGTRQSPHS